MSYNIDTFKLKELMNVSFPVSALYEHPRKDWHPKRINKDDGSVEFHGGDSVKLSGEIRDEIFFMHEIECSGECSGAFMEYIIEPALKQSKGIMRASCVWEGGDSINKILAQDGKVTWVDIEI